MGKRSGVYSITNKINGKVYVGQSLDIDRRWISHKTKKGTSGIGAAIRKYGARNFEFCVLMLCCKEWMNHWEMYYISKFDSVAPNGYNLTHGGDALIKVSGITRKKISDALRGNIPWNKNHTGYSTVPCSDEKKSKISASLRGHEYHPMAEDTRLEVSARNRGVGNPFAGKKHTNEARSKISASNKGKTAWNIGKEHSDAHKENLRLAWVRRKERMSNDKTTN